MRRGQLFLDSADLDLATVAATSGVVSGITTNPAIMHEQTDDGPRHMAALLGRFPVGPVFYQPNASTRDGALAELEALDVAAPADRERVVVKLPAQRWWFALCAELSAGARQVAMTAVYDPGQVVCAVEAGARWVIPYVDRASRLEGEKGPLVPRLASFVPPDVVLLAASIKSTDQAVAALADGAGAVTTTWDVLEGLMTYPLTDSAVQDFLALNRPS